LIIYLTLYMIFTTPCIPVARPNYAVVSAYHPTGRRTANGERTIPGRTCAVRHGLPLNKHYWINGRQWWANDRMSRRWTRGERDIDLCLTSRGACDRWGVRRVVVSKNYRYMSLGELYAVRSKIVKSDTSSKQKAQIREVDRAIHRKFEHNITYR